MKSAWKKYLLFATLLLFGGILLFLLEETIRLKNTGFGTKTLWDWMELLIIPLVLASGAFLLNQSERAVGRKIAEDRAELEREIATDRQQEAAFQTYLDRMADLILNGRLITLIEEEQQIGVRKVARTRTLTVLRVLDVTRKGLVLRFLYEAGLINNPIPIIDLQDADLRGADLFYSDMQNTNLSYSDLHDADLRGAGLEGANLQETDLTEVSLNNAQLTGANLNGANLVGAKLIGAILRRADLRGKDLVNADLSDAILTEAKLTIASLEGANLTGAIVTGADLTEADLTNAKVSSEQLTLAESLGGRNNARWNETRLASFRAENTPHWRAAQVCALA